jgi:two-component system, OmpR family, KDP operon response regulator KdpE
MALHPSRELLAAFEPVRQYPNRGERPMTAKRKILVIEDDPDQRLGMRLRLAASGYQVTEAADGGGALGSARRDRPDLVLLDIGLPGEDGYQVMEKLRAIDPALPMPIVVVSGRHPKTDTIRALDGGAAAYLQKPFDHADLLRTIQRAVGDEPLDT